MTVLSWPEIVCLVNPMAKRFYKLGLVEKRIIRDRTAVMPKAEKTAQEGWAWLSPLEPEPVVQTTKILDHSTISRVTDAYYLAGFQLHALQGPLPKGKLRAIIDGEPVVHADLSLFTQNVDPEKPSCPWALHPKSSLFPAIRFTQDITYPGEQLGLFLPNGSHLEAYLELEPIEEQATLEIAIVGAEYTCSKFPNESHNEFAKPLL